MGHRNGGPERRHVLRFFRLSILIRRSASFLHAAQQYFVPARRSSEMGLPQIAQRRPLRISARRRPLVRS